MSSLQKDSFITYIINILLAESKGFEQLATSFFAWSQAANEVASTKKKNVSSVVNLVMTLTNEGKLFDDGPEEKLNEINPSVP